MIHAAGYIWHEAQNFTRFAFLFTLPPTLESNKCLKTKKKGMDTMFSLCLYDRLCIIVINLWTELAPGWLADDCSVGRLAQVAPFEPASRCANPHPDASCEFAKVGRLSSESCGFAMVVRWYKPTSVPRPPGAHRHPILIIVQLNFCKKPQPPLLFLTLL